MFDIILIKGYFMIPKLLASDLDGTLFHPKEKDKKNAVCIKVLSDILKENKIRLAFVTGRNIKLVEKAVSELLLPDANAVITDVGTKVYFRKGKKWVNSREWEKYILKHNPSYNAKKISLVLKLMKKLERQPFANQSKFKQSYFIDSKANAQKILREIEKLLGDENVKARIIYSVGIKEKKGLIDIIPQEVSKHAAIGFLRRKWGIEKKDVIVAGDSGNDLEMLLAGYNAVLVGNALLNVRNYLLEESRLKNIKEVYFAKYSAACGIVEGIHHFMREDGL
jgi:sucrose-6-phosphatase